MFPCPTDEVRYDDEISIEPHQIDDSEFILEAIKDIFLCLGETVIQDFFFLIFPGLGEFEEIGRGEFLQCWDIFFITL